MKKANSFAQDLKEAKTPEQTYQVLLKHSNRTLAMFGTIYLVSKYEKYVNAVGQILKHDRLHQKLNRKGHRSNAVTKGNAKRIYGYLNHYTNKAVDSL